MSTQPTLSNSYQLVMSLEALLNFGLFFVRVKIFYGLYQVLTLVSYHQP